MCSTTAVANKRNILHNQYTWKHDPILTGRVHCSSSVTPEQKVLHLCKLHTVILDYDLLKDNGEFSKPMISSKTMTKILNGNFGKKFSRMASRKNFRHFLHAHFFISVLLIRNHVFFSFILKSICTWEFSCNFNLLKNSLVQINSKLNSKTYEYLHENRKRGMHSLQWLLASLLWKCTYGQYSALLNTKVNHSFFFIKPSLTNPFWVSEIATNFLLNCHPF